MKETNKKERIMINDDDGDLGSIQPTPQSRFSVLAQKSTFAPVTYGTRTRDQWLSKPTH
jgi:hypothetical protein